MQIINDNLVMTVSTMFYGSFSFILAIFRDMYVFF